MKPPTGTTGNVEYDWTQSSAFSTLSASDGTVGNSIKTTSSSTSVDLVTTGSDTGTITVTVIGYKVSSGGVKTQFGEAQAKVTMSSGTTGNTGTVIVVKYDPIGGNGYFTAFAFATFSVVPNATQYVMSSGGNRIATLYESDLAAGAPVVDTVANQDTSTLVPYSDGNGSTKRFFNLGGGLVGYMALTFTGTYQPVSYEQSVLASDQQAMAQFAYTVTIT